MRSVFEKSNLSSIQLKNRIIRSATYEAMADDDGRPTDELGDLYERIAKGGTGAIITSLVCVQQNGKAMKNALMFDRDELVDDYRELVERVHKHDTAIILQAAHAGRQTLPSITGTGTVSPSAKRDKLFILSKPSELSEKEIFDIIDNFCLTIERAKKAGFDGVQLHAAHGYLLSQFITPYMNTRKDKWGGNSENRFRIIKEILIKARKTVGDFPVIAKINCSDGNKKGTSLEEAIKIAKLLEENGCDAVEVSCGVAEDMFNIVRVEKKPAKALFEFVPEVSWIPSVIKNIMALPAPLFIKKFKPVENYNVLAAERIKENVKIPVIVVGGIRNINDIETIIKDKSADFVSMARPFVIEPSIVNKFKDGKKTSSGCISCGYCILGINTYPLKCYYGKLP